VYKRQLYFIVLKLFLAIALNNFLVLNGAAEIGCRSRIPVILVSCTRTSSLLVLVIISPGVFSHETWNPTHDMHATSTTALNRLFEKHIAPFTFCVLLKLNNRCDQ
jgi:hypothetical protein